MSTYRFFILFSSLVLSLTAAQHARSSSCCKEVLKISATGVGNVAYKANIAVVRLGVSLSGRNASGVQAGLASRTARLVRYVRLQNVRKLETTGISLNAERNYSETPATIVGYSGSNTVSFEVPASRAGKLLAGVLTNGASSIDGVSSKGAADVVFAARKRALRQATSRAQAEARTVAFALGKKLGGPINVQIDTFDRAPVSGAGSGGGNGGGGGGNASSFGSGNGDTPVVSGTGNVRSSVSIDFKIY